MADAVRETDLLLNPAQAARAVSLRYVSDTMPGIRRNRSGRGFSYEKPDGTLVKDAETLARIRTLAIPPAWTDVWICPSPNGHLQATGRDARRRKQYRYHKRWREVRDEAKYGRLELFGETLPRIRARVQEDLDRSGLPREKVLATIVRLLESTFIRVGNEEYARNNGSFGLTTLRNRHVQVNGSSIKFRFPGKSGKNHAIRLTDRRLARLVKRCRDLPGQELFQYLDETGEPQPVNSSDVNDYLREISGEEFTAKDFRTWAGTLLAARHLAALEPLELGAHGKSAVVSAAQMVAEHLGNTPAICRKCYIHPAVLNAHLDEDLYQVWLAQQNRNGKESGALSPEEKVLLKFLTAATPETPSR